MIKGAVRDRAAKAARRRPAPSKVELRLPADGPRGEPARPVVVDTNVALDLLIFSDPRTAPAPLLAQRAPGLDRHPGHARRAGARAGLPAHR